MENMVRDWKNNTVLVTGGAGFIGGWIAKSLREGGIKTAILDIKNDSALFGSLTKDPLFIRGDLRNIRFIKEVVKKFKVSLIYHLAAQAIVGIANKDPLLTLETNIQGTWNILEAARLCPKSIKGVVVASSDKAYGEGKLPYKENSPLAGKNPYDASKSSADLISQMYYRRFKLPVAILRSGNVYGGGDVHFSRLIPDTIRLAFYNKNPIIRSNGEFIRDYIYIKDEVSAFLLLGRNLISGNKNVFGQAFNVSANNPQKAKNVVARILKLMEKSHLIPKILNQAEWEIVNQSLDSKKIEKILGWKAKYSFDKGLKETINWYSNYFRSHGKQKTSL